MKKPATTTRLAMRSRRLEAMPIASRVTDSPSTMSTNRPKRSGMCEVWNGTRLMADAEASGVASSTRTPAAQHAYRAGPGTKTETSHSAAPMPNPVRYRPVSGRATGTHRCARAYWSSSSTRTAT